MNVLYCFEYIVLTCRFLSNKIFFIKYYNTGQRVKFMITNYLIYLTTLSKEEQLKQILILLAFFTVLSSIIIFLKILKTKFLNENKESLFQNFLKKL